MVGGFFEVEYQFKLRDMFSKEADKIIAKFDKVRDAATRANTRFVELSKNVKTSSDNLKQLSSGIKPVNQGLQTMNQSAKAVTASVKAQNTALVAQSRALKVARASMVDYNRMAGVMMQAGQGLFRTGNMLGLTVTAPIVAGAFIGGKKFIGREERATQVRKTAGLSKSNADYLIKLANKFSGRNPTSTEEMLDIAGILGQAGFGTDSRSGTEDLMNKSETVAKMMASFDMGSEKAATTYATMYKNTESLMNRNKDSKLYGKFSDQYFNRLLDFVNLLENTSPVRASAIFEAMKTRTLAAGLMIPGGMDPYETAAITTQMLRFKSASRGSNIVTTLFKNFTDPKKVGDKMAKQFRDNPFETLIGFFDVMKGAKTDKAYDMAVAVNKSYSGELSAIASFEEQIRGYAEEAKKLKALAEHERITGNIQKGGLMYGNANYSMDESYRLKVDTFLGKLSTLKNNIDNVLANFFTRIEPTLTRFIDKITPRVLAFAEAIEKMPERQIMMFIAGVTALALLAPTLMLLGTILNSFSAIIKTFSTVKSGILNNIFKEIEMFVGNIFSLPSRLPPSGGPNPGGGIPTNILPFPTNKIKPSNVIPITKNLPKPPIPPKGLMSKLGEFAVTKGGNLAKLTGGLFKQFLPMTIISTLLEGALTGQWTKALLGGAGGILGTMLGGAALGSFGGPIGMLIGALGGNFLGTEASKGLTGGVKKLFPDIDNTFIEGLKLVWNILKIISKLIVSIYDIISKVFVKVSSGIANFVASSPDAQAILKDINWWITGTYKNLKGANEEMEKFLKRWEDGGPLKAVSPIFQPVQPTYTNPFDTNTIKNNASGLQKIEMTIGAPPDRSVKFNKGGSTVTVPANGKAQFDIGGMFNQYGFGLPGLSGGR